MTLTAGPQFIHACACRDCQRDTGSAFSYSAFFREPVARIAGEHRSWRRSSDAGRWQESNFCPTCGVSVFTRLEVLPDVLCVPVGCFSDASFEAPGKLYWASRRPHWLELPAGIERVETQ